MQIEDIRKGSRGGILKIKRSKGIKIEIPIKMRRWGKDYREIVGGIFVIKNGEPAVKKKLEVCLELQRGQEN